MARTTSISTRLFLLVVGLSLAWFTLTTAVQTLGEVRSLRLEADRSLTDVFRATRAGLEAALWNLDTELLNESVDPLSALATLAGGEVRNDDGQVVYTWGVVGPSVPRGPEGAVSNSTGTGDLFHRFDLRRTDSMGREQVIGDLLLVTSEAQLQARLADRLGLIFSTYLANTIGLALILALVLQSRVARPLGRIAGAIRSYRFDREPLAPLPPGGGRPDELQSLWQSFADLTAVLRDSWLQQRVMSAILEEAAVMALVCDADGLVLSSNAQARVRLLGAHPGGRLSRLAYGDEADLLFPQAADLLARGQAWRGELEVTGSGADTWWISAALVPLTLTDDPRARWGVMVEDVSARRLTEQYRRERDLAREATRAKSLFLANLSHEIRTPMNAVVGLTALALAEDIPPKVRGYLAQLERSGAALLGVINDILDFAKLEEGKVSVVAADFRPADLTATVAAMTGFQSLSKGVTLGFTVGEGVPEAVRGDGQKLQQVLLNLVANAVKFTDQGQISVRVDRVAGPGQPRLRWEVADTGIGIAPADQARLFRSFTQVDSSATRRHGGTGLGLAISRQLIELLGGQIGVESRLSEGSRFWFEVPLEPPLAAADSEAADPAEVLKLRPGLRVLVAEDNRVNQLVAKEILARVGITAVVVANGTLAVEKVKKDEFDVVLMDLQMPVTDGFEATRQIRALRSPADLPILALTAHTVGEERQACLAAGMQDLVAKPVEPEVLYRQLIRWARSKT